MPEETEQIEPDSPKVDFIPADYLREYFDTIDDEDAFGARFVVRTLRDLPANLKILEFGGGPVLSTAIALASRASEVHFSDFLPDNLADVRRWLNDEPGVFDWGGHIRFMLETEGHTATPEAIAEREALTRQKITQVFHCDARLEHPLGENTQSYDLVVALYCTEVPVTTVPGWKEVVSNVSSLVKPGGSFILAIITGSPNYKIGDEMYHCVSLTPNDLRAVFMEMGYLPDSFNMDTMAVTDQRAYKGLAITVAQKPSE
jgi:hypothetical protein